MDSQKLPSKKLQEKSIDLNDINWATVQHDRNKFQHQVTSWWLRNPPHSQSLRFPEKNVKNPHGASTSLHEFKVIFKNFGLKDLWILQHPVISFEQCVKDTTMSFFERIFWKKKCLVGLVAENELFRWSTPPTSTERWKSSVEAFASRVAATETFVARQIWP